MTNISLGQFIDESLSSTDTNNPKRLGSFSDDYTLTGVSNWQQVQVNLGATAFDAYLQLVNASTGEVIAENNNYILGSKNSQLKFTVVPGVNYAIRATSLNANETGDYTIVTNSLGTASSLVVTEQGRAGTVDPLGRFVPLGTFAAPESKLRSFNDIAFSNDNKILSIKQDSVGSQLYSLDPGSGSSSLIGNLPSDATMTSLEFSPDRTLYGASDSPGLYTINPQTGVASSITNFNTFFGPATTPTDLVFDPVNNRFLFAELGVLFSVSLTGESTLIGETGFGDLRGLSFEGSTLVGFTLDERIIINPTTGKGTLDKTITGLEYRKDLTDIKFVDINTDDYILGAGSIPIATLTPTPPTPTPPTPTPPTPTPPTPTPPTPTPPTVVTPPPTPPTVVTPTPTPPTVVTPTPLTLPTPPPTSNNTQQPSTNSSSISITSASDLADGDKTLVPGGTILVNGLATGINSASSNPTDFLRDNLKAFLGDNPIRLSDVSISVGTNPVEFDTEILLPNNIAPGNYPLKLVLNTGTGSSVSAVGSNFDIGINPPIGSSLKTPFEIGGLSKYQDFFNSVDSSNTSDFFRFRIANRSSFNLLLDPQNAGQPSGDATVLLRSNDGRVIEGGIQIGKTSILSRELPADDYLIEVQRKPNASDEKIDYNLRTSAIALTEAENQTLSLQSPSEIAGFVTNDVNEDGLIDKSPKLNDNEKDKERLAITISNRNGSPITSIDPNKETWIVAHGNTDKSTSAKMSALADAVAEYKKKQNSDEEPQVLVVDWSQPADNNSNAGLRPDLAAGWVNKVAEFAVHSLKDVWGIPANKINLVGHSLGTFVSGLIAEKYLKYTDSKINKLILLDSARTLKTTAGNFLDTVNTALLNGGLVDYDLDGSQKEIQSPPKFSEVANFSRSIWGDFVEGDGLGSPRYNETADESIQVVFKGSKPIIISQRLLGDGLTNHGDLVYLFSNILKGEDAISNRLSLDSPLNKEWRTIPGSPEAVLEAEKPGDLDASGNDKGAKVATLIAKNATSSGKENDIVYGTNGNDTLDASFFRSLIIGINSGDSSLYSDAGNDIFYGEAGDDIISGGSGNDTIDGAIGNDTINGEQDNDIIFGGVNDERIWGGKGDDTLRGGQGKDTLTGGFGSDIFVFSPGDGSTIKDEADIITAFGTGFIVGGGADRIGLAGGLNSNIVEVVSEGGVGLFGGQTLLKANGEFLAIINGKFNKSDLNFIDTFNIL